MKLHGNARLSPFQRALMCSRVRDESWQVKEAAKAAGCSTRTCHTWLSRWDAGEPMTDRSSVPHTVANRTEPDVEATIEELRRLRWTSTRIAAALAMPTSTVCAVLKRIGLNRLWRLEPPEPPNRYCRRHPGELIHVDIKRFGRFEHAGLPAHRREGGYTASKGAGFEYCHVAVDDTTRVAYVEILDDQTATSSIAFLRRAIAWFAAHGVVVQRVMTDNGPGYCSKAHRAAITQLGVRHIRTRPYRPRTNGKAERFIQTLQREWAYAIAYSDSQQRRRALLPWLEYYNCRRPHSSLAKRTPISQLD